MSLLLHNRFAFTTPQYIEDVFAITTYTGTGASLAITDNINRNMGALDMFKRIDASANDWALYDTVRGVQNDLTTVSTAAQTTQATGVTAFSSTGVTVGALAKINANTGRFVKFTFRFAPNFFWAYSRVHTNGVNTTVDLSVLGTVGMVVVKSVTTTSNWFCWHRSHTAGKIQYWNTTAAETTDSSISVSGTTLTISSALASDTYIIYAWAHDTRAEGLVQCGGGTSDSSGNLVMTTNWEQQLVLAKKTGTTNSWDLLNTAMGWDIAGSADRSLLLNSAAADAAVGGGNPTTSGGVYVNTGSIPYIYFVIRRGPMKPPAAGTEVFNTITRTGNGAVTLVTGVGFPPDLIIGKTRSGTTDSAWTDRLRGPTYELYGSATTVETARANDIQRFEQDGFTVGTGATSGVLNTNTATYVYHCLHREPYVFDQVCDTGTGSNRTISHALGVAPEMIIRKCRSSATNGTWAIYHTGLGSNSKYLPMNGTGAETVDSTVWNNTAPTSSVFSVGTSLIVNTNAATYVSYLFASRAGISKVFSFSGDGTTGKIIDCGFTNGARFVLIFSCNGVIDSTNKCYVWDSSRGIVAGNDPFITWSATSVSENTATDYIDPHSSGFIVNWVSNKINESGTNYIGVAFA